MPIVKLGLVLEVLSQHFLEPLRHLLGKVGVPLSDLAILKKVNVLIKDLHLDQALKVQRRIVLHLLKGTILNDRKNLLIA